MARDLKAKIKLTADTKQANSALNKTETAFASLATGVLAGVVSIAAFTRGIGFAISAAIEQERVVAQLNNQLRALGPEANKVSEALQSQASALQATSGFGDEAIIASQSLIAAFTKEQSQIEALTAVTIDFAVAKGIDLKTAADLVAKSFGTSTNALTRYGVEVNGAAGSTERLTQLTQGLQDLFGGAAAANLNTFGGQIGALAGNLSDTAESVGGLVTENKFLLEALKQANARVSSLNAEAAKSPGIWALFTRALRGFQFTQLGATRGTRVFRLGQKLLADAAEDSAEEIEELTDTVEKLTDALNATDPAVEATLKALEKFITTDQQVNQELAKNADLLEATEILFQKGIITRQKFEEAEAAILSRARELNGELVTQAEALDITEQSSLSYAEALRVARGALDNLTDAEIRNTDTVVTSADRRNAARLSERNLGTQIIFGQQTTQGGTFFIPDEVVGGQNGRVEIVRGTGVF